MSPFLIENPGITVEVFALCYNEAFMLPEFIRHYQQWYNAKITIYDNMSTDSSRDIARTMGCNVLVYDSGNTIRDDLYVNIKNNCWKYSTADFVIVCDIDEFLEVKFLVKDCTIIRTEGYDMVGPLDTRLGLRNDMWDKCVMFRRRGGIKEIGYDFGCHRCHPQGTVIYSKGIAKLLHRKWLSPQYVFDRHSAYEKRLSDLNKQYGWGEHYHNTTMEKIEAKFKVLQLGARPV